MNVARSNRVSTEARRLKVRQEGSRDVLQRYEPKETGVLMQFIRSDMVSLCKPLEVCRTKFDWP